MWWHGFWIGCAATFVGLIALAALGSAIGRMLERG